MNHIRHKYFHYILLLFTFTFFIFQKPVQTMAEDVYYFQWFGEKQNYTTCLYGVQAYGQENEDVIELYGVNEVQIEAFTEGNLLILTLPKVQFSLDTQFYSAPENPYLTYCLINSLPSRTVIHFILKEGGTYQITQASDCVRILLSGEVSEEYSGTVFETPQEPEEIYSEEKTEEETLDTPNIEVEENISESEDMEYSDFLCIPLPEEGIESIVTQDDYLNLNFKFLLSGNLVAFFKENAILNPYDCVQNHIIYYDALNDTTIVTFNTKYVCGYSYEITDRYLVVKAGKPSEFYSKIILLDAGHGGIDPGAVKNSIKEKDINFTILNNYVKEAFCNSDIKVYFTRESDSFVDLYARADYARQVEADLFISLHANANNSSSVSGTEVFYSNNNNTVVSSGLSSAILAKTLVDRLALDMGTKNRGFTAADFIVVKYNTIPAVLIELGFMTNSNDLSKLTGAQYQQKAANAIYETVVQIFEAYPTGR